MPKGKFDFYTVPSSIVGDGSEQDTIEYRFETTGRGKAAVERWQRQEVTQIWIDGDTAAEAAGKILSAAEGLEDTYVNNEGYEEYGDSWSETFVKGWADVVVGTGEIVNANEEIRAVKRYVTDAYERQQAALNDERAKAESEIKRLVVLYPDLVAQYAPHPVG